MDAEIKQKWVKALRSRKYKQGKTFLKHREIRQFCCLGVLCDIQGIKWDAVERRMTSNIPEAFNAGLTEEQRRLLAAMNDGSRDTDMGIPLQDEHSFREIADYIEKNF